MKQPYLGTAFAGLAAIALIIAMPASSPAQLSVIDGSNLAQNVLQAARMLEQINNQIQSLQNQAAMLQNMALNRTSLNYSSLSGMTNDLQQIGNLINQGQGIGFDVQSVETLFSRYYPQAYGGGTTIPQMVSDAQTRWRNAHDAFQQTLLVQSQIAQTVQADTAKLASLVNASQGAVGSLQAQQATNQLLALSIKQQLQVQSLLAAQGRAQVLNDANNAEAEEEARAAAARFLGDPKAFGGY
jgi:P-type conjugative transfer protein TrbJ